MDQILLTGMKFFGYHGCLPEERKAGQVFFVDLALSLDLSPAGRSDDLGQTVNYAAVFDTVRAVVEGEPRNLIEAVAEAVAVAVLEAYPAVESLQVTLHKPHAPIAGQFRDMAVSLERRRVG